MHKTDIDKEVRKPPQMKLRKETHEKTIKNKLKKFSCDRIYKTKMVRKKKLDA